MKELISKTGDGNYTLTPVGEQELYAITTQKLIQYYLREIFKKDAPTITATMNTLNGFLSENFKKVDDYLKKLPELANFIQENDLQKLQKFMGQYFVMTLQKEKQILINREKEKSQDQLDNPFWVPSNKLLKETEAAFVKSPPLRYPPDENEPTPVWVKTPEKREISMTPEETGAVPGVALLETLGKKFLSAKPLEFKDSSPDFEETNPFDRANKIESKPADIVDLKPAGIRLLDEIGFHFVNCQPLDNKTNSAIHETNDRIPVEKKFITIKTFATLLSNISKFTKAKDNEGYQNWYNTLQPKLKAAIKINSLINSEQKGNAVNWGNEIMMYAASANENKDSLYQLTEEVKLYLKVIHHIRHRLTNDPKIKLNSQEASSIYTQSIGILGGNDSPAEKKSAISILLFQVTDQIMRDILLKDFKKIILALS